jgi:GWxTD domain-containing protein
LNYREEGKILFFLILILSLICTFSLSESKTISFQSDHIVFVNDQMEPVILISLFVTYDQLSFQIEDSVYRAVVDISSIIYESKKQKGGDIWKKEIVLNNYEETNSNKSGVIWAFELASSPGEYDLQVGIKDLNSKSEGRRTERISVPDMNETSVWISKPGFLIGSEGLKKGMLIATNLNVETDSIFTVVEIVSSTHFEDGVLLRYKVIDKDENEMMKINKYLEIGTKVTWKNFLFPILELKEGEYTALVEVIKEGKTIAENSKAIFVSYPFFMSKRYLERVEQMEYIANGREMKELKTDSPEDRKNAWENFWSKKDPIPETPLNETSEEYFNRVDYANEHFKSFQSGWKTDRGRVYIIYGQPDDIEYHPFELGSPPYQIWYYFSLGRRFVFADLSMTGDYIEVRE